MSELLKCCILSIITHDTFGELIKMYICVTQTKSTSIKQSVYTAHFFPLLLFIYSADFSLIFCDTCPLVPKFVYIAIYEQ